MLHQPTPFQSVRKEYSITHGNELSHTLKIMIAVLTKLSLLRNAVPLHSNNIKLVLFSLKYLGRRYLFRENKQIPAHQLIETSASLAICEYTPVLFKFFF